MITTRSDRCSPAVTRLLRPHVSRNIRKILGAVASLFFFSASMQAQTAHFGYALSTLGSGFSQPTYAALDSSGNLFVTDEGTASVYELTVSSGYSTVKTLSTAFGIPTGIAVDADDNVFVTDQSVAGVYELTVSSGYTTVITLGSGFSNPNGVAVDANGNVFVADTLNNAIKEILAVSGSIPPNPTINTLGGSYNHPTSVAVDSSGNVFVADLFNSAVKEIVAAGGYTTVNTLGSGFSYPAGVALDANDNVYVADSGNGSIKEILASGGYNTVNTLVTGLPYSAGVAVNSVGNVFIASFSGSAMYELTLNGGVRFGSAPVATTAPQTIPITFIFDTGGTIGTPSVLTQGAPVLDFTDAGTGTCTTNGTSHNYNPGDSCTVAATFTPTYSGIRYGAVTLSNGSGAPIVTGYVSGIGIGPQVSFSPAALTALHGGFNYPNGIAIDGSGNVYVADQFNNAVREILATGGYITVNTLGSGFNNPVGVAVDGGGNVFVADTYHSLIKEILAGGGYTVINTLGSGFNAPNGLAVDGNGNVFVADSMNGAVKEIPVAGGYSTVTTLASGFSFPIGIAVDSSGDVFVADLASNLVSEIVAAGGYTTVRTLGSGFTEPAGIAADGEGNLFVSDYGNNAIKEILVASGYATIDTVGSGLNGPIGVAVDRAGNIFFADSITNTIKQLNVVNSPALSFATTAVGSTSSDSPKAVTLINNGNAALTFETPSTGLNPSLSTEFTFSGSSTCPQLTSSSSPATLAAGTSCLAAVSFTPTVPGSITGSMVVTDNALNAPGPTHATQSVALSGTATAPPITATTTLASVALTQNHATSPFIPVTGSGGYGALTYGISPALPAGLSFSSVTGTVSGTPTAVSSATTYTVIVTDPSAASDSATFSLSVKSPVSALAGTSITFSASPTTQLFNNPIVLTAQVISPTPGTLTGSVSFLDGTTAIATAAIGTNGRASSSVTSLAQGSHSLTAAYSGNADFQASTSTGTGIAITVGNINLNLGGDQNQSVIPGAAVSYKFPLSPLVTPTFLYAVQLTATGLPPGATYTFSPATIPAGSASLPVTLTVQTAKETASLSPPGARGGQSSTRGLAALALGLALPLFGLKRVRKGLRAIPKPLAVTIFTTISLWVTLALSGCGAGGFFGRTSTSGSYTITVTATSADLVRTSTVLLTIQ